MRKHQAGAKYKAVGAAAPIKKKNELLHLDFDLISTLSVKYSAPSTDLVAQQ